MLRVTRATTSRVRGLPPKNEDGWRCSRSTAPETTPGIWSNKNFARSRRADRRILRNRQPIGLFDGRSHFMDGQNEQEGNYKGSFDPVCEMKLIRCEATFHPAPGFEYLETVPLGESEPVPIKTPQSQKH